MKPDVLVRLTNQLNTTAPELAQLRYAKAQKSEEPITAMYGTPYLLQRLKIAGALPLSASVYKDREDMYRKELPDDHAEVMMTALMMDGRTLMPALTMPTVKGELAAP